MDIALIGKLKIGDPRVLSNHNVDSMINEPINSSSSVLMPDGTKVSLGQQGFPFYEVEFLSVKSIRKICPIWNFHYEFKQFNMENFVPSKPIRLHVQVVDYSIFLCLKKKHPFQPHNILDSLTDVDSIASSNISTHELMEQLQEFLLQFGKKNGLSTLVVKRIHP
ncbi:hypothetical protein ACH5RR_029430 [Cinchona calisaya]|uniref:Uncharacterized protein n=1 Tax=Cinchona calisaya TaxID=153742 RepID=A0ABD2YRL8_9GENT